MIASGSLRVSTLVVVTLESADSCDHGHNQFHPKLRRTGASYNAHLLRLASLLCITNNFAEQCMLGVPLSDIYMGNKKPTYSVSHSKEFTA